MEEEKEYLVEEKEEDFAEQFNRKFNGIGFILKIIGSIIIIASIIFGYIVLRGYQGINPFNDFAYIANTAWLVVSFFGMSFGFSLLGFGEILKLLQGIYNLLKNKQ